MYRERERERDYAILSYTMPYYTVAQRTTNDTTHHSISGSSRFVECVVQTPTDPLEAGAWGTTCLMNIYIYICIHIYIYIYTYVYIYIYV